jgi:DNA-binding CsgD family transcriptional regulator
MQTVGQRLSWVTRGELALAQGKPDVALDIARRLAGNATPTGEFAMPLVALLNGRALTALGRFDEAEAWLRAAERRLRAQGARTSLRRALTHLTALYQQMGRADDATRAADEARELAYQMAETIPDAVLHAVFLRQCLASLPPEPKRSAEIARAASLMLTAREREVAALVAQGKSNRAISDELVISERTTESHVTNILGKLGFSSRAQIAAWAVDIGLAHMDTTQQHLAATNQRARRAASRRTR